MIDRRQMIVLSAGALAGCATAPALPSVLTVVAQGSVGMNPGPDGTDRPLTVTVLQLRDVAGFVSADTVALQDPAAALGADVIAVETITLSGATPVTISMPMTGETKYIGAIAGFRDPSGKTVRGSAAIDPTKPDAVSIMVTSGGMTFSL